MFTGLIRQAVCVLSLCTLLASTTQGQSPPRSDVRELKFNRTIERNVSTGMQHDYKLALQREQVLFVEVEEESFDVKIELIQAGANVPVASMNSVNGFERETLTFAAAEGGDYLLRLSDAEGRSGNGGYRLRARVATSATEKDRMRIKAEKLLAEATELQKENTADKIREAIGKREQALTLWQNLADRHWESHTLAALGGAHHALIENNKAFEYFDRSLQIIKELGDKKLEAAALNWRGIVFNGVGEHQQAIDYHQQAFRLFQFRESKVGLIISIFNTGDAYNGLEDKLSAIEHYQKALGLARQLKHRDLEALSLNALCYVAHSQKEHAKVLDLCNQALAVWKMVKHDNGRGVALQYLGKSYLAQGDAKKALEYFDQALVLFRSSKNRGGVISTLADIGNAHEKLGETEKVIDALKQVVAFYQEFKIRPFELIYRNLIVFYYERLGKFKEAIAYTDEVLAVEETVPEGVSAKRKQIFEDGIHNAKAMSLMSLGRIYENTGDFDKSFQSYQKALAIYERRSDKQSKLSVAYNLAAIAQIYRFQYKWEQALEYYQRALKVAEEIDDKTAIFRMLNSLGLIYGSIGEKKKELEFYEKSLALNRMLKDKSDADKIFETATLNNIGTVYLEAGEPNKALDYHRQALKIHEGINDINYIDQRADILKKMGVVHSFLGEKRKALETYRQALEVFRQAPPHIKLLRRNRSVEGSIYNNIGVVHGDLGETQKEFEYYDLAVKAAIEGQNNSLAATALQNTALAYYKTGDLQKSQQLTNRVLELNRATRDKEGQIQNLSLLAGISSSLMDKQAAITHYTQALAIAQETSNKRQEVSLLNSLSVVHSYLSQNDKAHEFGNRALELARQISHKDSIATSLNNIAVFYSNTGEKGKAAEFLQQALAVVREIGNKNSEVIFLNNIAFDYVELGEYQLALEHYGKSLTLSRETGGKEGQIYAYNGIGNAYLMLGEKEKKADHFKQALEHYEQSLKLSREARNKEGETAATTGIGRVYTETNETAKALPYLTESLQLSQKYRSRFQEDAIHVALGKLYQKIGSFDKAAEEFQQALMVARAIADKDMAAKALKHLMLLWKGQGNVPLAIFYGKQSANEYQKLRNSIRNLKRGTQEAYRDKVTDVYRELADLLIAAGRLPEAEQTLAMLKQQEAFEFIRRDAGEAHDLLSRNIGLSERERSALAEYARLSDELIAKSQKLKELDLQGADEQSPVYKKLKEEVDNATEGALLFFKKLEVEFTKKTEDEVTITARTIDPLRARLREAGPGVVLISTYLLPDRYRVIISTGRTMVDRKTEYRPLNMNGEKINQKIMDFKRALQNPYLDPRPLGKELYDIFVKPIEKDLQSAKAKTLLWSLDGSLRYIPVAALYDGNKYLGERYQNVFITLGRSLDFNKPNRADWRVLGLGVSKQYREFSELPSVPLELRAIVRDERIAQENEGVMPGIRLLDADFTARSFTGNLKKSPDGKTFTLIHLATHFRLGSNRDDSGLLLGDGQILSLYTINRDDSSFDFANIELLTLSACETGVSVGDSNGGEVESLGMIAQKNGAKAILASLWKVGDESTAVLMSEFYRLRQDNAQQTKAEAMQLAQRAMIEGKLQPTTGETTRSAKSVTSKDDKPGEPPFPFDQTKPYAHPYYWSPFILIGNWR